MDAADNYSTNRSVLLAICTSFLDGLGVNAGRAITLCANFETLSTHPETLIPGLLELAAEAGARRHSCIYVSTPITTGWHHHNAHRNGSPATPQDREELVDANRRRGRAVVHRLRAAHADLVIDPTGLDDVPGWIQEDYHRLWIRIILEFAHTVVFVDGWQYSVGCAKEFGAAMGSRLAMLDQKLARLTYDQGLRLLRTAAREVGCATEAGLRLATAVSGVEAAASGLSPLAGDDQ